MEAFVELTPRQAKKLSALVNRNEVVDTYLAALSYRLAGAQKFPSLDEYLHLTSGKDQEEQKAFDETTDKFLEAEALKRLQERQQRHGQ